MEKEKYPFFVLLYNNNIIPTCNIHIGCFSLFIFLCGSSSKSIVSSWKASRSKYTPPFVPSARCEKDAEESSLPGELCSACKAERVQKLTSLRAMRVVLKSYFVLLPGDSMVKKVCVRSLIVTLMYHVYIPLMKPTFIFFPHSVTRVLVYAHMYPMM